LDFQPGLEPADSPRVGFFSFPTPRSAALRTGRISDGGSPMPTAEAAFTFAIRLCRSLSLSRGVLRGSPKATGLLCTIAASGFASRLLFAAVRLPTLDLAMAFLK
jgi:hypothetical protein